MICRISLLLLFLAISKLSFAQYPGYGSEDLSSSGSSLNVESSSESKAPAAPMAPPRVPLDMMVSAGSSLGYRPPPPPLRRDEQSIGQCAFGKLP